MPNFIPQEPEFIESQQKYFEDNLKYYSQTKTREEIGEEIHNLLADRGVPRGKIAIEDGAVFDRAAYRLRFLWFGQVVEIVTVGLPCKSPTNTKTFQRKDEKIRVDFKTAAGWQALRFLHRYIEHVLDFQHFAEEQELFAQFMIDSETGKTFAALAFEKIQKRLPKPEPEEDEEDMEGAFRELEV